MNVLSIDFDIIMEPDIEIYNNMIRSDFDDEYSIERLRAEFPLLNYCRANFDHYKKILDILLHVLPDVNKENIRISVTHEDIKNLLQNYSDVTVYNIDHHHDLGYPNPQGEFLTDKCLASNWGDYFFKKGIIKSFHWYKNKTSQVDGRIAALPNVVFQDFCDLKINDLPKFDAIFICLSTGWVPKNFYPLFYALLSVLNKEKETFFQVY